MKILLTGASGFLGRALRFKLLHSGFELSISCRKFQPDFDGVQFVNLVDPDTDWSESLAGQKVVVHTAALAHAKWRGSANSLDECFRVNVDGALNLARQAADAGVERFVFISTIGVNGGATIKPFVFDDPPKPTDYYALSKWEAEQGLWEIQRSTGMELVIIRPPLIYGFGAPGNFGALSKWVQNGIPLPLGSIRNKRSFVSVDNLVDLIDCCVSNRAAANQVLLAADGQDISTTDLIRKMAAAVGKPARLFPVPARLIQVCAAVFGKKKMADKLIESLQVDISRTCELLSWKPPYTVEESLRRCFNNSSRGTS